MPLEPSELFPEVPNLYEFPSVHAEMIYDEERVTQYQKAIEETVKKGDIVVDVGAGTGLLSFLCVKAGAARVHAIERSTIIRQAERLADANGLAGRITFHATDSRTANIGERADVIVSELIGHMVFEEGMVEALIDAKKRFAKPRASILPKRVTLYAAPVIEEETYSSSIECWNRKAWGMDFSIMREEAVSTSYLVDIAPSSLLARPEPVFKVDFSLESEKSFKKEIEFTLERSSSMNGLAFWFDADLSDAVLLPSSPWTSTHWKQCFVPFSTPAETEAGSRLVTGVELSLRNRAADPFEFNVVLKTLEHADSQLQANAASAE